MIGILILLAAAAQNDPPPQPAPASTRTWSLCADDPLPPRYYPEKAMRLKIQGTAHIQCRVTPTGQVKACTVLSEPAPEFGFGEAALRIGCKFTYKPSADGRPFVTGPVPIRFKLPD